MGAVSALMASSALAQEQTPLAVIAPNDILNEYYEPMLRSAGGALVHILDASGGILPPDVNTGAPQVGNAVLYTTSIGAGITRRVTDTARFSAAVTPRPAGTVIARVYNATTLEDATFYADSQTYEVGRNNEIFYPEFTATSQAVDSRDDDGDGLNNSWEDSLGLNSNNPDSDGDGMNDYHEFLAGTDGSDADDFLKMVQVFEEGEDTVRVQWRSSEGRTYEVQRAFGELTASALVFEAVVTNVTAGAGEQWSVIITNAPGVGHQHFRVRLITPDE